ACLVVMISALAVPCAAQDHDDSAVESPAPAGRPYFLPCDMPGPMARLSEKCERVTLQDRSPAETPSDKSETPAEPVNGPEKPPNYLLGSLVAGAAVVGSAANSFFDGPHESYHFTSEGWFGRTTYAGGADKASHFTMYHIVSKELANVYARLGFSENQS